MSGPRRGATAGKRAPARRARRKRSPGKRTRRGAGPVRTMSAEEVRSLRREMGRGGSTRAGRWSPDPHDVERSLGKLVLTLVEFLRRVMERQAVRRMESGTLDDTQAEDIGLSLMRLERTIREMAEAFGLDPDDLNLDLGPLGRLH
jgi:hypothetical protein